MENAKCLIGSGEYSTAQIYVNYTGKVRHAYTIFMCTGTNNFFAFVIQCYKFPMCCTAHFHVLSHNVTSNIVPNIPLTIQVLLTLEGGEMSLTQR